MELIYNLKCFVLILNILCSLIFMGELSIRLIVVGL